MSNNLPITVGMAGALPPNLRYTPQELAEAIVARLRLQSTQSFVLFVAGVTEPTSDDGPWFKDNKTWYYFDIPTGKYQPIVLADQSLRYTVSATAPDHNLFTFWIETDANGIPQSVKTWAGGAWTDVYAAAFAAALTALNIGAYYKKTEIDAMFESFSIGGKAQIDYANLLNVPAASVIPLYQFRLNKSLGGQTIASSSTPNDYTPVTFDVVEFDPNGVTANSVFTCPKSGYWDLRWSVQLHYDSGSTTDISITVGMPGHGVVTKLGTGSTDTQVYAGSNFIHLTQGATVSVKLWISTLAPSAWSVDANADDTYFAGYMVRSD